MPPTWTAFDIETTGALPEYALQPWRAKTRQAYITCYAEVTPGDEQSELVPTRGTIRALAQKWVDSGTYVAAWNAKFEAAWLFAYDCGDLVHRIKWVDGMLLWKHLENAPEYATVAGKRRSYGLKAAVAEFLPEFAGYEADVDFHDTSVEARETLRKYNVLDAKFTLHLTQRFYDELAQSPERLRAAMIEAQSISLFAEANYNGICLDTLWLQSLDARLDRQAQESLAVLREYGATPEILASPAQLSQLLYETWGLPAGKQTATGANSTDKEVLHELALADPRAKAVHAYREAIGNRTKFVSNMLESVNYNNDGRAHPEANIFGTYSGRATYSSTQGKGVNQRQTGWALHQHKRGADYRGVVVAPPGYTLAEFDAAGQEFRWMAILSGDETMQQLCQPGEDAHAYMGAGIARQDYHDLMAALAQSDKKAKDARQLGKVGNLSCQYRTSAARLRSVARTQYGLPMELPEATHIRETYLRTYPGVVRYWAQQIAAGRQHGFVQTLAGRRVHLPPVTRANEWSVQSTAINYPVQGVGADQKYLALAALKPYLLKFKIKLYFELHDGLYFIIPDDVVETCVPEIKRRLGSLPYARAWGFQPPIPLPFDAKVGKSWGNLREWK